ncbi:MAG: SpoIIE family protein phosphatase [Bdellovibrionota bacterium]
MEDKKLGLSLKYKLLMLLTFIPLASLSVYLFIATKEFEKDKLPYVLDSTAAMAKSLAQQVRVEIDTFLDKSSVLVRGFDLAERKFNQLATDSFNQAERFDALVIFQHGTNGQYEQIGSLVKENDTAREFSKNKSLFSSTWSRTAMSGLAIQEYKGSEVHLVISFLIGSPQSADHTIVVGLYRSSDIYKAFTSSPLYGSSLINKKGEINLGSNKNFGPEFFKPIVSSALPEGTHEIGDEKPQIVGYSSVGVGQMYVVSIVDKNEALKAVQNLIIKSLIFFVGLIAVTVIISLLASIKLTSTLRDLFEATKLVAKGQFDVKIIRTSNDEVGGLADGFNFMAKEMERLLKETKAKARMEGELETVKLVQETLFPPSKTKIGNFSVVGHFEPASECGGDWWNYSMVGEKLYLWIGDATGHGAPAAMVTSAAKAAATIIENIPGIQPGTAMGILNKAIAETTKGRILMTFFIASIDLKTGEMIYANASHEPPYMIRGVDKKVSKKNLEPLLDAGGARLGDSKDTVYKEGKITLNKGDAILMYTDGIVDLKNLEGKAWGERGFIKSICESASSSSVLDNRLTELKSRISDYRQATELPDDITLVMCQYDQEAA